MQPILSKIGRFLSRCWPESRARLLGFVSIVIVAFSLLTMSPVVTDFVNRAMGHYSFLTPVNEQLNPFRSRNALYDCGFPVYDLRIKPAEYKKIIALIDKAKARGELTDDLKQWSEATFICGDQCLDVKIRVRGDLADHWAGPRKSWRVRCKKDNCFEGQREFNLIIIEDDKAVQSRFHNEVFRKLGLVTFRDGYAVLRINGTLQGLYYATEHVDKPLLAYNRRPETSVFVNEHYGPTASGWKEQITENDFHARRALNQLLLYENNPTPENLSASLAVTDIDDYLRFIAGTTLFCSSHSRFLSQNHKVYYDTSRGLFYRIPWDLATGRIPTVYRYELEDPTACFDVFWWAPMSNTRLAMITEPEYRLKRNRILWSLVQNDDLIRLFDKTYDRVKRALRNDVMTAVSEVDRVSEYRSLVSRNISVIRRSLIKSKANLQVNYLENQTISLDIVVNNSSGIAISGFGLTQAEPGITYTVIRDDNGNGLHDEGEEILAQAVTDANGDAGIILDSENEILQPDSIVAENQPIYPLPGTIPGTRKVRPACTVVYPKRKTFSYLLIPSRMKGENSGESPQVRMVASNAVTGAPVNENDLAVAVMSFSEDYNPVRRKQSCKKFLDKNPQFTTHPTDSGVIVLKSGKHRFHGITVIPEKTALEIEPGTTILLDEGASLVSYGPVVAEGTEDVPITVKSSGEKPWGTFAVVRPGKKTVFNHVYFSGGNGAWVDGVLFTGSLAIHDGDAALVNCRFEKCGSEDAVNIKNGKAHIAKNVFLTNASDAIDLDFVTGDVLDNSFYSSGGDSIDVSGATLNISSNYVENSGDKGISIGEASDVEISDNLLIDNVIGVAVKDKSKARIDHCTLVGNDTSVAVYRKKPMFGGADVEILNSILVESDKYVVTDGFSTARLSRCIIPSEVEGIDCSTAPGNLAVTLRNNSYVYSNKLARGYGERDGQPADRPGITRAVTDTEIR